MVKFSILMLTLMSSHAQCKTDCTVECRNNAVQLTMILHTTLQWLWQNINPISNSQKTPHTLPSRASYGVFYYENFEENWPCYNGTALYLEYGRKHHKWKSPPYTMAPVILADRVYGCIWCYLEITGVWASYYTQIYDIVTWGLLISRVPGMLLDTNRKEVNQTHCLHPAISMWAKK